MVVFYPRVMNETTPAPGTGNFPAPTLPRGLLLQAIGDETRWKILRELAAGEPLMVKELAQTVGRSESATGKHLAVLRKAGITRVGRGRLQQLRPQFVADAVERVVDFGYCQLRLGVKEPDLE